MKTFEVRLYCNNCDTEFLAKVPMGTVLKDFPQYDKSVLRHGTCYGNPATFIRCPNCDTVDRVVKKSSHDFQKKGNA